MKENGIKEPKQIRAITRQMGGVWKEVDAFDKNGKKYKITYLQFEIKSEWGIDGGRISKFSITHNGKELCGYDRGWYSPVVHAPEVSMIIEDLLHQEN